MAVTRVKARRSLRFSLRTFLVVLTAFGVMLGVAVDRARTQNLAVQLILESGGHVLYDYEPTNWQWVENRKALEEGRPQRSFTRNQWEPEWLLNLFGVDMFHGISYVYLDSGATSETFQHVEKLNGLLQLRISGSKITDADFDGIARLQSLKMVSIFNVEITDDAVRKLAQLNDLRWITILNAEVTDEALPQFEGLDNLWYVKFARTKAGVKPKQDVVSGEDKPWVLKDLR